MKGMRVGNGQGRESVPIKDPEMKETMLLYKSLLLQFCFDLFFHP